MRRVLLTLVIAGSFAAAAANVPPVQPNQVPTPPPITLSVMVKDNSAQSGQRAIADAATSVSLKQALARAEDDSNVGIYGTLLITLVVMATIALRRIRTRKP